MTLPASDTTITYPDGDTHSVGIVLHVEPLPDDRAAVLLDRTAFHPVDTAWPDQPADRGIMRFGAEVRTIADGITGGIHEGALHLGQDLPVRTGTPDWVFVVAHIIDGEPPEVGDEVHVDIDAEHRHALSAAHTACHLAALALDQALADAWRKPVQLDALGNPAFDQLAIQSSRIAENQSTDVYRIGKSLRRKGFAAEALDHPAAISAHANETLAAWIDAGGAVAIEREADTLSARRRWVCQLAQGRTDIPCGGTHLSDLRELGTVRAALTVTAADGAVELTMLTTVS